MRRGLRFGFTGAVAVAAAASLVVWLASPALAAPGPDLYIDVVGVAGCTTNASPPPAEGDVICTIGQGAQFTVQGVVRTLDGLADLNDNGVVGYAGMQLRLFYSSGLISVDRPAETELGPPGAPYWPDCSIRAEFNTSGVRFPSCLVAGKDESTYVGLLAEEDFVCEDAGRQTVTLDSSFSYLHNEFHGTAADDDGDEVLTIDCTARGPETKEATPDPTLLQLTPRSGQGLPVAGGGPANGVDRSPVAITAASLAAIAVAASGSAVLLAKRHRRE